MENDSRKIYIWSNYKGQLDADKIRQHEFEPDAIHVFINLAKVLFLVPELFENARKILFTRGVHPFNGLKAKLDRRGKGTGIFEQMFRLCDKCYDRCWYCQKDEDGNYITPVHIKKTDAKVYYMRNPIDDWDLNDKGVGMVDVWGRTSGFMAYRFVRDMFPDREIVLVNFHRKDGDDDPNYTPYHRHDISVEEEYFQRQGVKNIMLG